MRKFFIFLAAFTLCTIFISAQNPKSNLKIEKLFDDFYRITYEKPFLTYSYVMDSNEGLLLLDTGFEGSADEFYGLLKTKFNKKVKYIIISHHHPDHLGAIPKYKDEAIVIANQKVKERLCNFYSLPVAHSAMAPNMTFEKQLDLYFVGNKIEIRFTPGGDTDNSSTTYFPKQNILYTGDIIGSDNYPYVDIPAGGKPSVLLNIIKSFIVKYPKETKYVVGHGRVYTQEDLKKYHTDLSATYEIIKKLSADGISFDDILKSEKLTKYSHLEKIFPSLKRIWAYSIVQEQSTEPKLESISAPLSKVIVTHGIEKAVQKYSELKKTKPEKYNISENELNILGYELIKRNMLKEALGIMKLNATEHPDSGNAFDSLAEVYMLLGNKQEAIKNYEKSLKLLPTNNNAKTQIQKLKEQVK